MEAEDEGDPEFKRKNAAYGGGVWEKPSCSELTTAVIPAKAGMTKKSLHLL